MLGLVCIACVVTLPLQGAPDVKPAPATAKGAAKSGKAPTAASLTADMRKAVTYIAIEAGKDLSPKSKAARPFWSALQATSASLTQLEAGVKAKNPTLMLKGLAGTGRSGTQVINSWTILRRAHPKSKVSNGVVALSKSFNLFRQNYGPAAARRHKGGKVTAAEAARVKKCAAKLAAMRANLKKVALKAKKNSHQQRLAADQLRLLNQLAKLQTDQLAGYAAFLDQWELLDYALHANANIMKDWYPDCYEAWDDVVSESHDMEDEFQSSESSNYESWDYSSTRIETPQSYYQETAVLESVTETEIPLAEKAVADFSETAATEENATESKELAGAVLVDEAEYTDIMEDKDDSGDDADVDSGGDESDGDADSDDSGDDERMTGKGDDDSDGDADSDDSGDDEGMTGKGDDDSGGDADSDDSGDDESMTGKGDDDSDDDSNSDGGGGDESMTGGGDDDSGGDSDSGDGGGDDE